MTKRKHGALPSKKDYRDFKDFTFGDPILTGKNYSPSFATDISACPVFDQGQLGICTSNLVMYIEWLYFKKTGTYVQLSRRFLYSVTKNLIDKDTNEGSEPRNILMVAQKYGVCLESTMPSSTVGLSHSEYIDINAIPSKAWPEALNHKIGTYLSINTDANSMSSALYKYGMLYTAVTAGDTWWTDINGFTSEDPNYIDPIRYPNSDIGGHAIIEYGYDTELLNFRNSWGDSWDKEGNGDRSITTYPPIEAWAIILDPSVNVLPSKESFNHVFSTPMSLGDVNQEVVNLQTALMIDGCLELLDIPSLGFYGTKTRAAVFTYQQKHNVKLNLLERTVYKGKYCGLKTCLVLNEEFNSPIKTTQEIPPLDITI